MKAIYQDSKDLHILSFVAYGNSEDNKLYNDAAFTDQVKAADAKENFSKGLLVVKMDDKVFKPVSFIEDKVVVLDLVAGSASAVQLATKAE